VGLLPRYLEIAFIDPHQTEFLGNRIVTVFLLQLIKFWTPHAAGRRSAAERIFVAPPYYSQHAVFASLCVFFHSNFVLSPNSITNYDDVNGEKFLRPSFVLSYCLP